VIAVIFITFVIFRIFTIVDMDGFAIIHMRHMTISISDVTSSHPSNNDNGNSDCNVVTMDDVVTMADVEVVEVSLALGPHKAVQDARKPRPAIKELLSFIFTD
jgi:hypothetical protein